jgi:MFS family permease
MLRGPRAAFALIANRNFGPYFVGNALSASGGWFHNLAAALLVYRQTHSPFLLGVLNFAQFVPTLLLAPWAGAAADRFDRRRILYLSQGAAIAVSVVLGTLTVTGRAGAWLVIGFSLLLGLATAFATPAQQALVTSLVEPRDLGSAIALNSMTFNIARALGPALAAAVIAAFGLGVAFFVNAGSFLCFTVGLLVVRPRPQRLAARAPLRESLTLLRDNPRLLWLLFVVAAVGFASDPVNTESPAFAHAFGFTDTLAGILIGVFGAGAVCAALFFAGREGSRQLTVVTLTILGLGIVCFSLAPSLWLALPFLFAAGFGYLASNARATTQLQLEVEEWQRGRIMALWSIAFLGLRPFASIVDGAIADVAGVRTAGVVLALPALLAAFLIQRRIRSVR